MSYHKCWIPSDVNRYFTTESMSKDREAFLTVHLPIGRIRVDRARSRAITKDDISEQELLAIVTDSLPGQPNRIFVISGETGSGKSELCQWLSYSITSEVHIPILIARSMTRLANIVAEITGHLGQEMPSNVRELTSLMPETVSSSLRAAMFQHLERESVRRRVGPDFDKLRVLLDHPEFERLMRRNFEQYVQELSQLEKARTPDLLPETGFRDTIKSVVQGLRQPAECYAVLQQAIVECLRTQLHVEDLIDRLKGVSHRYAELRRRPVLLIEDITTFQFLHNDLLDYLYDLSAGSFDVVLGVTTGFERANQNRIYKSQDTSRDRTEARFLLTDEQNETLFLSDRRSYIDLARSYLRAVRRPNCIECGQSAILTVAFGDGLYPFNEEFLSRIYQGLNEDGNSKRTPRIFLTRTIAPVLKSAHAPFESIELTTITLAQELFQDDGKIPAAIKSINRWYGMVCADGVYTPVDVYKAFGVPLPAGIEQIEGYTRLPLRAGIGGSFPPPPVQTRSSPSGASPKKQEEKAAPPSPNPLPLPQRKEEEERQQHIFAVFGQLDQWVARKGIFPHRDELKRGILELLRLFNLDPYQISNPDLITDRAEPIRYTRGSDISRIHLEGSGDERSYELKLVVKPSEQHLNLLNQLLGIGLGTLTPESDKVNLAALRWYLQQICDEFQTNLLRKLESALKMPIEQFVVLTRFLLMNNYTGVDQFNTESLTLPLAGEPLTLQGLDRESRMLHEVRDFIDDLFIIFFHIRGNLLDYPALQGAVQAVTQDPDGALRRLQRINPEEVPDGLKLMRRKDRGRDELDLRSLVKTIRVYAVSLGKLQEELDQNYEKSLQNLKRIVEATEGVEQDGDGKFLDSLRANFDEFVRYADHANVTLGPLRHQIAHALSEGGLDFARLHADAKALLQRYGGGTAYIYLYLALQRELAGLVSRHEYKVVQQIVDQCESVRERVQKMRPPDSSQDPVVKSFALKLARLRSYTR